MGWDGVALDVPQLLLNELVREAASGGRMWKMMIEQQLARLARDIDRAGITGDMTERDDALNEHGQLLGERSGIVGAGERRELVQMVDERCRVRRGGAVGGIVRDREFRRGGEEDAAAERREVEPRLEDVEQRVQPVARVIAAQLCEQLGDRARLRVMPRVEDGEDQVILALEMIVERLLADSCVGEDAVEADRVEPLAAK